MLSIATMSTLGRRSKCINATHNPPKAESTVRLVRSARCGSGLARAKYHARCGQQKTCAPSKAQGSQPVWRP